MTAEDDRATAVTQSTGLGGVQAQAVGAELGGRAERVALYVVRQLVDHSDQVKVEAAEARHGVRLSLYVAPDDVGRVIGRRGHVAQSLRSVVRAAGARDGVDVTLDIVD